VIQTSICPIEDGIVEMLETRRDPYCSLQRPESPGLRGRVGQARMKVERKDATRETKTCMISLP
jgi:hypothetical protein